MTNLHDAKQAILLQVKDYCEQAEILFGVKINPAVKFDLKGTTAGQAVFKKGEYYLRFNLGALQVEGGWDHLYNDTVPHEVAHLVQRLHPDWPKSRKANPSHGIYWRRVMKAFQVEANRCHSLPLPKARQQRKWAYTCACMTHEVSTTLHNKMVKGQIRICELCKAQVTYKGIRQTSRIRQTI